MMRTLDEPSFIIQVSYGFFSLPLYIATIVTIFGTKARKGSFFHFYVACGIVNMIAYLVKYLIIRLPLYSCGNCLLAPYLTDRSYWWLSTAMYLHWHTAILQPILSATISLDRFIVLILSKRISDSWKQRHLFFLPVIMISPIVFTRSLIGAGAYYGYLPGGDNFRVFTTGDFDLLYQYLIYTMATTTVIGALLNFYVFLYFLSGRIKIQGAQRSVEIKLFCNTVVEITTQICATAATLLQSIFLSSDPLLYEKSRVPVLFATDSVSLLPPFILLFTCSDIRRHLFFCFYRKFKITDGSKTKHSLTAAS